MTQPQGRSQLRPNERSKNPPSFWRAPDRDRHRPCRTAGRHGRVRARGAERFRQGRHESEYFDQARWVDKTADDAKWAIDLATKAIDAAAVGFSAG